MTLAPDTELGPYRIIEQIGAGGMGEVYRAVDSRLGREVAVKLLAAKMASDDSLRRFEQEARAAGMLNHPNILAIYDIGHAPQGHYIVSELLDGESLRARLREGPVPPRKATDYAVQIARGLAAAHEKGIIHRDLKPENVFVTRDGQVKILDFGLVKLMGTRLPGLHHVPAEEDAPTMPTTPTEPGRMLGTVGYMSPEQIRGSSGDHRSDIFAFGAVLYEMLAGRPPFRGSSPVETLNAILKEEPPDFPDVRMPSALQRIVQHCLEKNPDERFQSARDVAFDIGSLSGLTTQTIPFPSWRRVRVRSLIRPLLLALAIAAAMLGAWYAGTQRGTKPAASFRRLTFRSGTILSARFSPTGETFYYSARWGGSPLAVYAGHRHSPESRDLGFGGADVLAVSRRGELAISLDRRPVGYLRNSGTLARAPVGGAPRSVLEDVEAADFAPDGSELAVVRSVGGRSRLEYPIGKVLYSSAGWISALRFSPRGDTLAFIDHPLINDDRGSVTMIDIGTGATRTMTAEWTSIQGLAWWPDGKELWFSAEQHQVPGRALLAVSLRGRQRVVATSAGAITLHDISSDGRAIVAQQNLRAGIFAIIPGETRERDLSWLDYSVARDFSPDGRTILFSESGSAGGANFGIYIRGIDGSPAIRLGEGTAEALSPDGKWVLSIARHERPSPVLMLPTGAGQPRVIARDAINHRNARWFPDGRRILFQGTIGAQPPRLWVQSIDGGPARAITPENVSGTLVTPDGAHVLGRNPERQWFFYPVNGGQPIPQPALQPNDVPMRFTDGGRALFVASFGRIPAVLHRVDLKSARRELWREAIPGDRSGLINVGPIWPDADGKTIVYSYTRLLSDLYILDETLERSMRQK